MCKWSLRFSWLSVIREESLTLGKAFRIGFDVNRAQPHMDVGTRSHDLVLGRSVFGDASRRRDERNIVVAAEKEWDRVSFLCSGLDSVEGRHEDVVYVISLFQNSDIADLLVHLANWSPILMTKVSGM